MPLRPILKMTTVDLSGGDSTEHWLCDPHEGPGPYASPSGNWIPGLDGSSMPRAVERAVQGRQPAQPSPSQGGTVRLLHKVGNANPLSFLAGRLYLGREMLAGYIGTDSGGTEWTPSAPLIVAKGKAAGSRKGGNVTSRPDGATEYVAVTEVFIRPQSELFERTVPSRRLLGYPSGLLGHDDASGVGTTSYTTLHAAYGFQVYALMPLVWPVGASDRMHFVGNSEVAFWVKLHTDGYSWRLLAAYNTSGGIVEIDGPTYQPDEAFHMLHMDFDTAPGGGGVAARWWIDGVLTSATSATAFATAAGAMQLMRFESDNSKVCATIAGAIAVFSALFTAAQVAQAVADRLPRDESGLVLYYPGPALLSGTATSANIDNAAAVNKGGGLVGIPITGHPFAAADLVLLDGSVAYDGYYPIISKTANEVVITATYVAETFAGTETVTQQEGTLYDQAAANAGSPKNCTFTNCQPGFLLEGYEAHAGTILPRIYLAQHMRPEWIDAPNRIVRFSDLASVERVSFLGDLGDEIALDHHHSLLGWNRAAPDAGEAAVCGWGGGVARLGSNLSDNDRLAGDVLGSSGWPYSLNLGSDYGDAYVDFPNAFNDPMGLSGTGKISFDFFAERSGAEKPIGNVYIVFNTRWLDIFTDGSRTRWVVALRGDPSGSIEWTFETTPQAQIAIHVEAAEIGSDLVGRLVVNGVIHPDGAVTLASRTLLSASAASHEISSATFRYGGLHVLPMRLWSRAGDTDAEAEQYAREFMFENPATSHTDLLGMWTGPDPSDPTNTVLDEVGTNHGTIINPLPGGNWGPGLCCSSPKAAAMLTLRDWGRVAESSVTIQSAAWTGIPEEPQSLWIREPITIAEAAATAIGPGFVMIQANEGVAIGAIVPATAANSSGTITADLVKSIGDEYLSAGEGTIALPPSVARMAWGHVADPQAPDSTVGADRAAIMSRAAGHAEQVLPVGTNATKYADAPFPDGRFVSVPGHYRDNGPTRTVLAAAATTWEAERPERATTIAPGFQAPVPGEIWQVVDPRDGSSVYVAIQQVSRGRKMDELDTRME